MPNFVLERQLCLNGVSVPLVLKNMEYEDIHGCGEEAFEDLVDLDCLPLKSTMDSKWLEKAFKLPARWWVLNASRVPLLQEIREAIEKGKVRTGGASRLSKKSNIFVSIRVRGEAFLVVNTIVPVTLCAPQGSLENTLLWFLSEFNKDLSGLLQNPKQSSSSSAGPSKGTKRTERLNVREKEILEERLQTLRDHPRCLVVHFSPSNSSLRIKDLTKKMKVVTIRGMGKRRNTLSYQATEEH